MFFSAKLLNKNQAASRALRDCFDMYPVCVSPDAPFATRTTSRQVPPSVTDASPMNAASSLLALPKPKCKENSEMLGEMEDYDKTTERGSDTFCDGGLNSKCTIRCCFGDWKAGADF